MYPAPGLVIETPTTLPSIIVAVPIYVILLSCLYEVITPTLTGFCTPDLYPDPLFPIETEDIVPDIETTTVPPAETYGWYPRLLLDPTDTITPFTGKLVVLISVWFGIVLEPTKNNVVIPEFSLK